MRYGLGAVVFKNGAFSNLTAVYFSWALQRGKPKKQRS
jgi:hypothetical protein